MKILSKSSMEFWTRYFLCFDWSPENPGCGFGFPCDAEGNVNESKLTECARESLAQCRAGNVDGRPIGKGYIDKKQSRYRSPAVGLCDCGTKVSLGGFTNTCSGCGADYNSSGQRLAPREQWGEETGEYLSDILNIK